MTRAQLEHLIRAPAVIADDDELVIVGSQSMRERVGPLLSIDDDAPRRRRKLQSGTVTVGQRTSADLRLNPHLQVLALDDVFVEQPDDSPPRFVQLPNLASIDVAELLVTIRTQLLRMLATRGVIDETTEHLTLLPSDEAERVPLLAQLASAAVSGTAPAGPERRQRAPIHPVHAASATINGPLCATDSGFSLHAATLVSHDNPRGKEALVRDVLRPPLAQQRLELLENGLCRLTLKRALSDGTIAIELDPLSLLCRLAASVPAPFFNTVRYGGLLAPAAAFRSQVIPPPTPTTHPPGDTDATRACEHVQESTKQRRSRWRPWAELLKRSFDIDLRCPRCNATMKLKSFLTNPKRLPRLLTQLGGPTEVQGKAPARAPPYFAKQDGPLSLRRACTPSGHVRLNHGPNQLGMVGFWP